MLRIFESFVNKMKAGFRRISKATHNEMTAEDLQQDAWIVAIEIGERRGREIDFSNPEDQNLVMSAVNLQNVKRGDWKIRKSVRFDNESEDDEGAFNWAERLPAQASSDPLISLLLRESSLNTATMLTASFSQAAAYVVTFNNFNNDRQRLCNHLAICNKTLMHRVTVAADTVKTQLSMFDNIERIPLNFMPLQVRHHAPKIDIKLTGDQWKWDFS
jgi:hypothetical protein